MQDIKQTHWKTKFRPHLPSGFVNSSLVVNYILMFYYNMYNLFESVQDSGQEDHDPDVTLTYIYFVSFLITLVFYFARYEQTPLVSV